MIQKALVNAGQSSVFFATFVSSYQALVCLHRASKSEESREMRIQNRKYTPIVFKGKFDHKLVYYILGLISSSSIFIEHQKRRTELALYVLPRGVDCLYRILLNRRLMIGIPYFDVAMFSTGMGLLTMYLQAEHEQMSGMVYGFMSRIDGLIDPKPR